MFLRKLPRAARAAYALSAAAAVSVTLAIAPQASADSASIPQTGVLVAYNHGGLWTMNCGTSVNCTTANLNLSVAIGTSPSVAKVGAKGHVIAFQSKEGSLWVSGDAGATNLQLGMMAGTSPSITALSGGGWQIAFQANTGALWTVGSDGTTNWGLPMDNASSPSIAALPGGGYEVAYQDNVHVLAVAGLFSNGTTSAHRIDSAMAAGTDPAIASQPGGEYEIAFTSSSNTEGVYNSSGTGQAAGWAVAPGTSPAISTAPPNPANPAGGYEIAFHGSDGKLWGDGNLAAGPIRNPTTGFGYVMAPGANPAVIGTILPSGIYPGALPGFEMFFQESNSNGLWEVAGSAWNGGKAFVTPARPAQPTVDFGTTPSAVSFQ